MNVVLRYLSPIRIPPQDSSTRNTVKNDYVKIMKMPREVSENQGLG